MKKPLKESRKDCWGNLQKNLENYFCKNLWRNPWRNHLRNSYRKSVRNQWKNGGGNLWKNLEEKSPKWTSREIPERMPKGIPGAIPRRINEGIPREMPKRIPENRWKNLDRDPKGTPMRESREDSKKESWETLPKRLRRQFLEES